MEIEGTTLKKMKYAETMSEEDESEQLSKGEKRRRALFSKYVSNLNLLVEGGYLDADRDVFICPICLGEHDSTQGVNPLTLEDAPPKSLGGKANTLTCKSCNNGAGAKIDLHLTHRMEEMERDLFLPGSSVKCQIRIDGELLQSDISVSDDGVMTVGHDIDQNHPEKLEKAMQSLKGGETVDLNWYKSKVVPHRIGPALLKTGFILSFEKLGFAFATNKCFDIVREQINNPDDPIYPEKFWFTPDPGVINPGVYFIMDIGLECILVVFETKCEQSTKLFGTFLPLPTNDIHNVIDLINQKFNDTEQFTLDLYPYEQDHDKYLTDVATIKAMFDWVTDKVEDK